MLTRQWKVTFAALLLTLGACANRGPSRPQNDPYVIRREQILNGPYSNAYDAVRALHPNWLVKRRNNDANRNNVIWTYVDGNKYGDVTWLRNIPASSVESIRRIDAGTATTRWGTGHAEGVVFVTTYLPPK